METHMTQDALREDLSYLRKMAQAGETAPLLGGRFLLWWSGLTALVILTHWSVVTGTAPFGAEALWPLWLGYIVIGSAGSAGLGLTIRNKPGLGSTGNRVESAVWQSAGAATGAYFLGVAAGALNGYLPAAYYNTILPVALAAYGLAWMTVARVTRRNLLYLPALAALAGAGAGAALSATHWVYPVSAAALIISTLAPGWLMLRAEPRSAA